MWQIVAVSCNNCLCRGKNDDRKQEFRSSLISGRPKMRFRDVPVPGPPEGLFLSPAMCYHTTMTGGYAFQRGISAWS